MIKIRISYTNSTDMSKLLDALKGFKIVNLSKEYVKKGCKNRYIKLE